MRERDMEKIAQRVLEGDRRALARLITRVESRSPDVAAVLATLYDRTGRAYMIGITGPPGAGKSTLTDRLIGQYRDQGKTVGVVAIDPSSPFSGGALLGDRVRMMQHANDAGVFIRSLGSRGHSGGLSRATREIAGLMDAFGFDVIIIETVGVGQTELDVMDLAHSVVVVFVPESGDMVQTMKAGLTEIADIFVVNKSDRPGADFMLRELDQTVEYAANAPWRIPVLKTIAFQDVGITELVEALAEHRVYREKTTRDPQALGRIRMSRLVEVLSGLIGDRLLDPKNINGALGELSRQVFDGTLNPYTAAQKLLSDPDLIAQLAAGEKEQS